jgi:hypothetical protein
MLALEASTNHEASTVLDVFVKACEEYGIPSRVHGDRGGENIEVSVSMMMKRGVRRASFIWGSYVYLSNLTLSYFSQINS